jgi:alanine racemase
VRNARRCEVKRVPCAAMTVRLTVREAEWRAHVASMVASVDGLVPVVKGNGYGFGRSRLLGEAAAFADHVCVGSVHELDGVPPGVTAVVLTPVGTASDASAVDDTLVPSTTDCILTVGSVDHVAALGAWSGRVLVKLRSSMQRFGATPSELTAVATAVANSMATACGYSLHLPLAGSDAERRAEVEAWLPHLDPSIPLWLSHLGPATFAGIQADHPQRSFRLRVGTSLWHGDKSFLHLSADVLDVSPVTQGQTVGYRHMSVPGHGWLVVVGAGSAHGVAPLADGLSPFHFSRQRLALVELPHMHASLLFVAEDQQCPRFGDRVDVQRPLISTHVDAIEWR